MGQPEVAGGGGTLTIQASQQGRDPALVDLYKLAVEMADRVSARRGTTNSFFITLQSALMAVLAFLVGDQHGAGPRWAPAVVGVVGLVCSITWFVLLRSYRDLNRAKFAVITEMETHLPFALFASEWASLKNDPVKKWRQRYAEFGAVERVIPWVFAALNLGLAIYLWSS